MAVRKVKKAVPGIQSRDEDGVLLTKVFGCADAQDFDPFLQLNALDTNNPFDYAPGFPWHPHRGVESLTYLMSGSLEYEDSDGKKFCIPEGCCQWLTAGSGIIHKEMLNTTPHMFGTQLWINLPQKNKMSKPKHLNIAAEMIPRIKGKGSTVAVISGEYGGVKAATEGDYVKTTYIDVSLAPKVKWSMPTPSDETLFIYILSGSLKAGKSVYEAKQAILFDSGDSVKVSSLGQGARFLLLMAKPLHETIAWGGSIVMNSRAELMEAFNDLEEGTFERSSNKAKN